MRLLFLLPFSIFLSFLMNQEIEAQTLATPLNPEEYPYESELGIIIGFGGNTQSGIFSSSCDCDFENGSKFGYTLGAFYEFEFIESLEFGLAGLYDYRGVESEYEELENVKVISQGSGNEEEVRIKFTNIGEADVSYFSLVPYLKWMPFRVMFLKTGLNFGFPLSSNIKHAKVLETKTARLSSGEIVSVELPDGDGDTQVIQDEEMPELNSMYLSIDPAIGFNFRFSEDFAFSPYFQYSIPLSNVSSIGSDFKVSTWRIMFEFKYTLTDYTYYKSKKE